MPARSWPDNREPYDMSSLRQRQPRVRCKAYLDHIRSRKCLICSGIDVEAAHLRIGCIEVGKRETGGQEKSDDRWALPLCKRHHTEQHSMAELAFWKKYELDPFAIAARLWSAWVGSTEWTPRDPRPQQPLTLKDDGAPRKSRWPSRPLRSRSTFQPKG